MPHVSLLTLLSDAKRRKYGIPNLWGGSQEMALGAIQAAEEQHAPLILCYNRDLCPEVPLELAVPFIVNAAEYANVPIATILDHGDDLDIIVKAMYHRIGSVMIDGSRLPYEENIRITREVVRIAHPLGIAVEAELGAVGGSAIEQGEVGGESVFTDPAQAEDFVGRTEIDALAISFGNVHGLYQQEPRLDFDRIRKIASLVDIPLVMHGASGLSKHDYPRIIASGISKINYHSAMAREVSKRLKQRLIDVGEPPAHHTIMSWNIEVYREITKDLLDTLGCSGKADSIQIPVMRSNEAL
jgi:fructose-bisphosphate aldolase class II